MNWTPGRQGENYYKKLLFQLGKIDCYLLKFNSHAQVPEHIDKVTSGRHFRINITLGGIGTLSLRDKPTSRLIVAFEPGRIPHSFKNGNKTTYQLSVGWNI